jgi:hypothetical protein
VLLSASGQGRQPASLAERPFGRLLLAGLGEPVQVGPVVRPDDPAAGNAQVAGRPAHTSPLTSQFRLERPILMRYPHSLFLKAWGITEGASAIAPTCHLARGRKGGEPRDLADIAVNELACFGRDLAGSVLGL